MNKLSYILIVLLLLSYGVVAVFSYRAGYNANVSKNNKTVAKKVYKTSKAIKRAMVCNNSAKCISLPDKYRRD